MDPSSDSTEKDNDGRVRGRSRGTWIQDIETDGKLGSIVRHSLDVDIYDETSATILLEIIAILVEDYQDSNNVKSEVEISQQWTVNLLSDRMVYGEKSDEILDLSKIERGRLGEQGLITKYNMYELVKNAWFSHAYEVLAGWQGWWGQISTGSDVAGHRWEIGRLTKYTTTDGDKALVDDCSLRVDENEVHDKLVGFWDDFAAFDHVKIENTVYLHQSRDTCLSVYCWMLNRVMNWYLNRFPGMKWLGKRHIAQRWCDDRGRSSDDVHAKRRVFRHNTRLRLLSKVPARWIVPWTTTFGEMDPNDSQRVDKFLLRTGGVCWWCSLKEVRIPVT